MTALSGDIVYMRIADIEENFPQVIHYLSDCGIDILKTKELALGTYLLSLSDEFLQEIGIDRDLLLDSLARLIEKQKEALMEDNKVTSVTIIGGHNKQGEVENISLTLHAGSITGIVGPTGSGKSRLLADVEWLANGDTPTKRKILINEKETDLKYRFSPEYKLVAQLSQNMNFVMDATVGEFIQMHAESRFIKYAKDIVEDIIAQANNLAGEKFYELTPLTELSGGQSRALMIADTAFLSTSPIVLIDEIENAGIDRKQALSLLVKKEKIILIATHDPILALLADRRIVIKNGGIVQVIKTSQIEKDSLTKLERMDNEIQSLRNLLRNGGVINLK